VKAWESDHNSSSQGIYFDNEWWADSDDEDEIGPPHSRDLVAVALSRLWIIQELAVSAIHSTFGRREEHEHDIRSCRRHAQLRASRTLLLTSS
jgi:hypothetical protein